MHLKPWTYAIATPTIVEDSIVNGRYSPHFQKASKPQNSYSLLQNDSRQNFK
ncbi:hypothetical protein [Rickettsia bellii]|uniref:hypothetical protein n=1 Tax=Rickettsia bellii TaxID=33990 RepID=UPI0018C8C478|nr:hypothetical protein [Rickettsia bellii]